jgi:phosphomannomutase
VPELFAQRGGTAVRSRVRHSYIKGLMAETGAIFGGEHSAHYYFRDFWGADSGMLAALHVLAALGGQDGPLSADGRLPALRGVRRDQLHRGGRTGVCRCGAEILCRSDGFDRPARRRDRGPR